MTLRRLLVLLLTCLGALLLHANDAAAQDVSNVRMRFAHSGKCLTAFPTGTSDMGTPKPPILGQDVCDGRPGQQWMFELNKTWWPGFVIRSKMAGYDGFCLMATQSPAWFIPGMVDMVKCGTAQNPVKPSMVWVAPYFAGRGWEFKTAVLDFWSKAVAVCLDVQGATTNSGPNVGNWWCNGQGNQSIWLEN